jgi:hypothetical protein
MTESDAHHPATGVRFLLERVSVDDDDRGAHYTATIYTRDARFGYVVKLGVGVTPELALPDGVSRASEALEARLVAIAKTIVSKAPRRLSEEPITWPRRVLRWKG